MFDRFAIYGRRRGLLLVFSLGAIITIVTVTGSVGGETTINNAAQRTEEVLARMRALSVTWAKGENTNGIPLVDWTVNWREYKDWPVSIETGGQTRFITFGAIGPGIDYDRPLTRDEPTPRGLWRYGYYRPDDWRSNPWFLKGFQPGAMWSDLGKFGQAHLSLGATRVFEFQAFMETGFINEFWWRDKPSARYQGEFYDRSGKIVGTAWLYKERTRIYKWGGKAIRAKEFMKRLRAIYNLPEPTSQVKKK